MSEDQIYVAIKLVTGENFIGMITDRNAMSITISNPIMVTTGYVQQEGDVVERLMMDKFCNLSNDTTFRFNRKDIIYCASLKESLIAPYKKLCEAIDNTEPEDHLELDFNKSAYIHTGSTTLN